ncbi:MAG: hypothetical protein WCI74_13805, partial [Actinomycetes bacterium]
HGYVIPTTSSVPTFTRSNPNQLNAIPWTNVNTIRVTFSEDVNISASDFAITGVNTATYTGGFSYGQVGGVWTATWSLPGSGVFTADKLMVNVSGNVQAKTSGIKLAGSWTNPTVSSAGSQMPTSGSAGLPFAFRVNMLPGKVGDGTRVNTSDVTLVQNALGKSTTNVGTPPGEYSVFKDVSGFGRIRTADVTLTRNKLGTTLPAGEPVANVFASGSSVIVESVDGTNGVASVSEMVWAAIGDGSTSSSTGTKKRTV